MIGQFTDISSKAKIGAGTTVSNFTTITGDVIIGENCWIGSGVNIMDGARIGNNVKIFPGAVISAVPQDLKYKGEITTTEIGDGTTIREYCTINKGTQASGKTVVGKNCLIMAYCHVAHDCIIGDNCVLANMVSLAGHIELGNYVVLGGMVAIAQFLKVGDHAMIGGYSQVRANVPPFVRAAREPLSYIGVNSIGLKRRGYADEIIQQIQEMYRILFVKNKNQNNSVTEIQEQFSNSEEAKNILAFLHSIDGALIKSPKSSNDN